MNSLPIEILHSLKTSIQKSISYLEDQRSSGFVEAIHHMIFPKKAGFIGDVEKQEGKTFQLAIINNALMDADSLGFQIDKSGVKEDIRYILNHKYRDARGGWKYFPNLPEIPPDADDLAEILQVLFKFKLDNISEICDEAISIVFDQNYNSNGSFETWIMDSTSSDLSHKLMLQAIDTKWGKGPDIEVIANLLYALYIYNPDRYKNVIQRGVKFITKNIKKAGYWSATWYCGKFYGTFVCSRIISAINPKLKILNKVHKFLRNSEKKSGGWGSRKSNPTDTALVLLILTLSNKKLSLKLKLINRALNYLLKNQLPSGRWKGTYFIQMDPNRCFNISNIRNFSTIKYKSDTITTAISLKALCSAYTLLS